MPLQDNKKTCPPGKCDYCVDPCRYTEGNTKYDKTWCYTKDSWAYCKLYPNYRHQDELQSVKTNNGHECQLSKTSKGYCDYHGQDYSWCYYNLNQDWDYCEIPQEKTAMATKSLYECSTWALENSGNDAEQGKTDLYYGGQLGESILLSFVT